MAASSSSRNNSELDRVLWWAANSGDTEQVKSLLASGAKPVFRNVSYSGSTAVHRAAAGGYDEVLEVLLAHGADANALTKTNWTPLHAAAYAGKTGAIRILLEHGADAQRLNSASQTAHDLALAYKQFAAAAALRQDNDPLAAMVSPRQSADEELALKRSSSKGVVVVAARARPSPRDSSGPYAHMSREDAVQALAKLTADSAAESAALRMQLDVANKKLELMAEQHDEVLSEKIKEIRSLKLQLEEMAAELEDALTRIEELEQAAR